MAWAVKYRLNFNHNQHNGDDTNTLIDYEVDIYAEGFAGSITSINGSDNPVTIKLKEFSDPFEPICTSNCILTIISESNNQWVQFQTAETYEYWIDVKKDGSTFWRGVFIAEPYVEAFQAAPYPVQLTFNDGLAELQYERFEDSGVLRAGFTSCIDIMTKCFSFLPFTRSTRELINIFDDTLNDADAQGLLDQLAIYEAAFWELDKSDSKVKGENCLEVLRGIMSSLKCRLIVSENKWYVIRIGETLDTTIKYVEYDTAGAISSNSTIDLRKAINKTATGSDLLQHRAGGNNTINPEYQEVHFSYTSKNITTLNIHIIRDTKQRACMFHYRPPTLHIPISTVFDQWLG